MAKKTVENFVARAIRLYEQEPGERPPPGVRPPDRGLTRATKALRWSRCLLVSSRMTAFDTYS